MVCVIPAIISGKASWSFASGDKAHVIIFFEEDVLMAQVTKAAFLKSASSADKVEAVANSADHKQNPFLAMSTSMTNEFIDFYKLSSFERKWLALPESMKYMLGQNMRFNEEIGRLFNDSRCEDRLIITEKANNRKFSSACFKYKQECFQEVGEENASYHCHQRGE